MKDGVLTVISNNGKPGNGDIITKQTYARFELTAEFKITPGANSGIKYFVQADSDPAVPGIKRTPAGVGFEFQILDDVLHPDAKLGTNGNRTIGSLYDVIPASKDKKVNPVGEWNSMRIVVDGDHVEHWLNGKKVLEFSRSSDDFKKHVAESKFKDMPGFGKWTEGHILLQDHGDAVSFRNVKIRVLP